MKKSVMEKGTPLFSPESPVSRAVKPDEKLTAEPGYVYHATNEERAEDIRASRYLKLYPPHYGTDQQAWPDGASDKRSYWSLNAGSVWQFAPEEGKPVVLRTKQTSAFKKESTGDIYTRHSVPAKQVEILTDKGWEPLLQ